MLNLARSALKGVSAGCRNAARSVARRIPWVRRHLFSSTDYKVITRAQAYEQPASGWGRSLTAYRQDRAYSALLRQMMAGSPRVDLRAAVEAVRATGIARPSILEVGCGGGYYRQVFAHMLDTEFDYVGVDYSAAMVEAARRRCPTTRFEVADACKLPFADGSFDIVFNGVCLMHILDFEQAIREGRRVAKSFCIYHSVPTLMERGTTYLSKYAYGSPVVEVIFNRAELFSLFDAHGLESVMSWPSIEYNLHSVIGERTTCETFLLRVR